jgi:O-methyltransferase involved in polyketide biosynthesis
MARHRRFRRKRGDQKVAGKRVLTNIVCRTKFLDDLILHFTRRPNEMTPGYYQLLECALNEVRGDQSANEVVQIALVGAGMDTRAQRLSTPTHVQWFELDRAEVLKVKHGLLSKQYQNQSHVHQGSCDSKASHFDLSVSCFPQGTCEGPGWYIESRLCAGIEIGSTALDSALQEADFDLSKPTLWILEGLTMYLTHDVNMQLLRDIRKASAPGSILAVTMTPERTANTERNSSRSKSVMSTWVWGYGDDLIEVC